MEMVGATTVSSIKDHMLQRERVEPLFQTVPISKGTGRMERCMGRDHSIGKMDRVITETISTGKNTERALSTLYQRNIMKASGQTANRMGRVFYMTQLAIQLKRESGRTVFWRKLKVIELLSLSPIII